MEIVAGKLIVKVQQMFEVVQGPRGPLLSSFGLMYIVACYLSNGSKLRWCEDIGEELPSVRGLHVGCTAYTLPKKAQLLTINT